jgi:hypothetical protein
MQNVGLATKSPSLVQLLAPSLKNKTVARECSFGLSLSCLAFVSINESAILGPLGYQQQKSRELNGFNKAIDLGNPVQRNE